jgi:hypothetical protein
MLGRPVASSATTRAANRAIVGQGVTNGMAWLERETEPTEVDFTAAGIGRKANTGMFPICGPTIAIERALPRARRKRNASFMTLLPAQPRAASQLPGLASPINASFAKCSKRPSEHRRDHSKANLNSLSRDVG